MRPIRTLLLAAFAVCAASAVAADIDGKALLNLLVRKGVITAEEAASLQTELTATAPATGSAANATTTAGPVAGTSAVSPGRTSAPVAANSVGMPEPVVPAETKLSPLSFRIGGAEFTPVGFMDFTAVHRNTNAGTGIGTNFAGIPFRNTTAGRMSETKFSAQNSRLGLRIDSAFNDTKVLGYVETDFLGNAPANLGVSSNSATLRMRLYFADLKWNAWEFFAGQGWTMLTPNRKGIGVMPSEIFYSANVDTNYQLGLTWARQAQVRAIYHAGGGLTAGLSLENPDQYAGGSNGLAAVTFPSGFNAAQVDTGVGTSAPNLHPDAIGKLAYDTNVAGLAWHFDVAGLLRSFKVNNYASGATPVDASSTTTGTGVEFNAHVEVAKGLTLIGNGYWSKGGGRYLFGQAPDFVVLPPDASGAYGLNAVRADSYLFGAEWQASPKNLFYAYYGHVKIGRKFAAQGSGFVGYGYPGAPTSHNRTIEEITFGNTHTLWKSPNYGALQIMTQFSHAERTPWFVPAGTPESAQSNMVFFNLRYVLP